MNSAKDYYNFYAKEYSSAIPWEELPDEVREYWQEYWQAMQERIQWK